MPCGLLWVKKKKSLKEAKETAFNGAPGQSYRSEAENYRQCVSSGGKTGRPERASGAACYWKAKGTKRDRIKCGLREVRKQCKFTTDLAQN